MMRALFVIVAGAWLSGCYVLSPCGGAECPDPEPARGGSFTTTLPDGSPGEVELAGGELVLAYTDPDGNTWEVVYELAEPVE